MPQGWLIRGTGRIHPAGASATGQKRRELAIKAAIVLFTSDLRVRASPALATACAQADLVVPLFAVDARLMSAAPNRACCLLESLTGVRESPRPGAVNS